MAQSKASRARRANDSARLAAHCAYQLLRLRAHTGETQKQLAVRLRMTESMISRLERGDHLPSLKTLCRIADAFALRLSIGFDPRERLPAARSGQGG
ncbi:MAG TPA: helix-turn-helix transcriptional regulator [Steroidobacteraceae bacterium]|jgi:transcriptional regulator with XRE-family HTH domain|nr:helix-turn-helix transcriptional regulator [Steroidobacteraceae bacterium]